MQERKISPGLGTKLTEHNFQKETQSEIKGLPSIQVYEGKCEDWNLGGGGWGGMWEHIPNTPDGESELWVVTPHPKMER